MANQTRFRASYAGIGEMLRAPFMVADMGRRADAVAARAVPMAPVGDHATDPHAGRYKASFSTSSGVEDGRAFGRVSNDAPEALAAEYGFHRTPKYRVLGRSLSAAGDRGTEPYQGGA